MYKQKIMAIILIIYLQPFAGLFPWTALDNTNQFAWIYTATKETNANETNVSK